MAKDLRGLFQNNRRREVNAVVGTVPYTIKEADLRSGTAAVVLGNEAVTLLKLPGNVIITGVQTVVETGGAFSAGTCEVTIGGTAFIPAATDLTTVGLVNSAAVPALIEGREDVVLTSAAIAGGNTSAQVKVVVTYIDFDRATMSYIGED